MIMMKSTCTWKTKLKKMPCKYNSVNLILTLNLIAQMMKWSSTFLMKMILKIFLMLSPQITMITGTQKNGISLLRERLKKWKTWNKSKSTRKRRRSKLRKMPREKLPRIELNHINKDSCNWRRKRKIKSLRTHLQTSVNSMETWCQT